MKVKGFLILDLLGRGASSDVYLGEDESGKQVALKILRGALCSDDFVITRFKREGEILQKLSDHRIVKCIDITSTEDGRPVLVQEYVVGKTLRELIEDIEGPLSMSVACAIGAEVLSALEQPHSLGVVHRDLKPENIFILPTGEIKISDFGIAKEMGSGEKTQTGIFLGSPRYMSPEQIKGSEIGIQSDYFSLGVLLYRLLCGSFPFSGDNYEALAYSILNNNVGRMEKLNPRIYPELVKVVEKSLNKDLSKRYNQAWKFRHDILNVFEKVTDSTHRDIIKHLYEGKLSSLSKVPVSKLEKSIVSLYDTELRRKGDESQIRLKQHLLLINPELAKRLKSGASKRNAVILSLVLLISAAVGFGYKYQSQTQARPLKTGAVVIKKKKVPPIVKNAVAKKIEPIKSKPVVEASVTEKKPPVVKRPKPPRKKKIKDLVKVVAAAPAKIKTKPIIKKPDQELVGHLLINVDQGTKVFLDYKPYVLFGRKVKIKIGLHLLSFSREGFPRYEREIKVEKNKLTTINAVRR